MKSQLLSAGRTHTQFYQGALNFYCFDINIYFRFSFKCGNETVTISVKTHHKRTRQTVILSTLMVAVLTPLAVYAANHVV